MVAVIKVVGNQPYKIMKGIAPGLYQEVRYRRGSITARTVISRPYQISFELRRKL